MKNLNIALLFLVIVATGCVVGEVQAPKDASGAIVNPSISSLSPNAGPLAGGTSVTLSGAAFSTGMSVDIGGVACASVSVVSTNSATCTTGVNTAGAKTVSLTTTDGLSASLASGYSYQAAPTVTGIAPSFGPIAGGTSITVSGTNFVSGATVALGGTSCTSVNVTTSTSLTCVTGSASAATVSAIVTNTDSQASAAAGSYTYTTPPNPTSVNESAGALAGGTSLTIMGTDFTNPAAVTINGFACSTPVVTGSTQIDCTTSGTSAAGTYDIVVTNSNLLTGNLTNGFKYQASPTVTSISPNGGITTGGTTVTITGTGFDTVNGVLVNLGGSSCGSLSGLSATSITCVTTSGTGAVAVNVVNQDGNNQTGTLASGFTYRAAPTITSTVAANGTTAAGAIGGGTTLTITGTGFVSPTVTVGGSTCTISSDNSTTINCATTAHSAGTVNVIVTNSDAQTVTDSNAFIYQVAPTVTSISPNGGPTAGTNTVTVNGTGFDVSNGVTVSFGGSACTSVSSLTATSFDCVVPSGSLGAVTVSVTNVDGDLQTGSLSNAYTYQSAPTISGVSPTAGPLAGTGTLTITGTNFLTGPTVTVGGSACPVILASSNATTIACTLPSGSAGAANVVVTNPDTQAVTSTGAYTYQVAPDLTAISPRAGAVAGAYTVTLTGTDFIPTGATVRINNQDCTSVSGSATTITCTAPGNALGVYDVVFTNGDGQADTLLSGFTYQAPPTITSTSPSGGPTSGAGSSLSINGTFDLINGVSSVRIGSLNCDSFTNTGTTITCDPPAQGLGTYAITVTNNDGGAQDVTLSNAYTYAPAPNVVSVSPVGGTTLGGTPITITGTGFQTGAAVNINVSSCNNVVVVSSTSITCDTPAGASSTRDITVTNTDNQTHTLSSAYTYSAPPTVTGAAPDNGSTGGGSSITITGTNFVSGVRAYINNVECTPLTFNNTASVTCTTPAGSAGLQDIKIVNPDTQEATGTNAFTYTTPPVVTGINPGIGTTLGGEVVTITGSNFDVARGISSISLVGTLCTPIVIIDSTSLTCTTGVATAGSGDVIVTNNDGDGLSGTLSNSFSYIAPPDITSVDIPNGSSAGGTAIVLTGTGFLAGGPTTVTIGGSSCGGISVGGGGTTLSCTTSANATPGTYTINITNFDGQSDVGPNFTYDPPPTFAASNPLGQTSGGTAGGAGLIINGSNFVATPAITIGGTSDTCTFVNASSLICNIPAGTAGPQDVTITNPDGQSATLTGAYTYIIAPTVSSVNPSVISSTGTTSIIVNGSGFLNGTGIDVTLDPGGTPVVCAITNVTATAITCNAPAHATGLVDVRVTNGDGDNQQTTATGLLNYVASPTIGVISPATGIEGGGTVVNITGTGFDNPPTPTVTVGGVACTTLTINSSTDLDCTTPAGTGSADIVITTYGTLGVTSTGGFTYDPPPTVTSVSPIIGAKGGGTVITITGGNFVSAPTSITVGGVACGTITFTDAATVGCTTGLSATAGTAQNIVVTNPDGQIGTGNTLFTYLEPPTISSVTAGGKASGSETVTINGTDFQTTATVAIGGSTCTSPSATSTVITCQSPVLAGTASYNVVVTNPDGQIDTETNGWQSQAEPTISGVTPSSGDITGGTSVTITGTNFESGLSVNFGVVPATVDSFSTTSLIVTAPTGIATGLVDVQVVNPTSQSVTSSNAYTYNPAAPELDFQVGSLSPNPPNPADYDAAPYSSTATNRSLIYTLKNVGSLPTSTITITLSGANTAAYFVNADTCSGTTLAADASCTVDIIFLGAIMATGSYTATINATDGTTSDTNNVIGTTP